MPVQRLRLVFSKGAEIKYISHLDLMRVWERLLKRAHLPLAHSRGFNPRPKLTFASALPVGVAGSAELLDVLLERRLDLREFADSVKAQLPAGIELSCVEEVPLGDASLPGRVVAADYEVTLGSGWAEEDLQERLGLLLAEKSILRQRNKPGRVRSYDLRPLIQELDLERCDGEAAVIIMRLAATAKGTGRPDEVVAALDLSGAVRDIRRVRLHLSPVELGTG
jgi:radical SAM-linked protein